MWFWQLLLEYFLGSIYSLIISYHLVKTDSEWIFVLKIFLNIIYSNFLLQELRRTLVQYLLFVLEFMYFENPAFGEPDFLRDVLLDITQSVWLTESQDQELFEPNNCQNLLENYENVFYMAEMQNKHVCIP